jgi:hypothetical protein
MIDQKTDIKVQIEHYAQLIADKKLDFTGLRKLLKEQQQDQDDINHIVKRVDKRSVRLHELRAIHSRGKALMIGGAICGVLGIILMVITFIKSGGTLYFLTLLPIVIGLSVMFYGRNDMNRY